ncbi:hypothetical protein ABEG18_18805 [Alsobacter sp. KACC 23698]|uniref:Uncharacterized protein n=1 Tax=Alsobacter sp. KACC 23698 TaxID=3149229 RepID=A0AAU7JBL1_9HYPH
MSLTIVNGYACTDCADIAKAKRGEDPNAKDPAATGAQAKDTQFKDAQAKDASGARRDPAVTLGGSLARADASPAGNERPAPPRTGALVDVSA